MFPKWFEVLTADGNFTDFTGGNIYEHPTVKHESFCLSHSRL